METKSVKRVYRTKIVRDGILIAGTFFVLCSCGRCGLGTYYTAGIQQYSGDGAITDASRPSGGFGSRGYVIDFPKFDLGEEYRATYHLTRLPTLGRARAEIVLAVNAPTASGDELKRHADGVLKCSLTTSAGKPITKFGSPLSDLIWSSPINGRSGYALYELEKSFFAPNSGETYTLTVEYSGDAKFKGTSASIYIWCGCGGS